MECDSGNKQLAAFRDHICTGGMECDSGDEQQVIFPDHICTGGVGYVADVTYSKVIPGSGERSHTQ